MNSDFQVLFCFLLFVSSEGSGSSDLPQVSDAKFRSISSILNRGNFAEQSSHRMEKR